MRELNAMELEHVSGASLVSRTGAAVLGAIMGVSVGTAKGGVSGGSIGGLLGVGIVSATVTMVWGGVMGVVQGGMYGFVNDWDKTLQSFNSSTEQWFDLNTPTPKA